MGIRKIDLREVLTNIMDVFDVGTDTVRVDTQDGWCELSPDAALIIIEAERMLCDDEDEVWPNEDYDDAYRED